MKNKYRSYCHLPNEKNESEVRIEYHSGFWRNVFRLQRKVLVFVKSPHTEEWHHKYIGIPASKKEVKEINTVLEMLRQQELYRDVLAVETLR